MHSSEWGACQRECLIVQANSAPVLVNRIKDESLLRLKLKEIKLKRSKSN